jgi:hypothetical protein
LAICAAKNSRNTMSRRSAIVGVPVIAVVIVRQRLCEGKEPRDRLARPAEPYFDPPGFHGHVGRQPREPEGPHVGWDRHPDPRDPRLLSTCT